MTRLYAQWRLRSSMVPFLRARAPSATDRWRQVPTIPESLMLKAEEREALERHVIALDRLCDDTPENSAEAEKAMLVVLTKMMMVLPSTTQNEVSAEARGEAFLDV